MKIEIAGGESLMVFVPSHGLQPTAAVAIVTNEGRVVDVITDAGKIVDITEHAARVRKQDPGTCSPLEGRHNVACRINECHNGRDHRTCDRIGMPEERFALWAHLVSEHACALSIDTPIESLVLLHKGEHKGPGTIRNHDEALRGASHAKIVQVLSEREDVLESMSEGQLREFTKRIHREISRRLGQAVGEVNDNEEIDQVYWAAAKEMWDQVSKLVDDCREKMDSLSKTLSKPFITEGQNT